MLGIPHRLFYHQGIPHSVRANGGRPVTTRPATCCCIGTYGFVGFVVHADSKRIYHAGDTSLFSDLKLLSGVTEEPGIDYRDGAAASGL